MRQGHGTIKNWDDERGFGFLEPDDGGEDLFVHTSSLPEGYHSLARGVTVEYETFKADRGRIQARVLRVGDFAPPPDPSDAPQPDVRRPRAARPDARPAPNGGRERIWTAERRTEIAEIAVGILIDPSMTTERTEAMRLLLEMVNDDARNQ